MSTLPPPSAHIPGSIWPGRNWSKQRTADGAPFGAQSVERDCFQFLVQHDTVSAVIVAALMDYRQYRRARRLVHECCNYDGGNCIALDDGEECVCVQSISYSLLCRWFRAAVLPLDRELETALFHRLDAKRCAVCGALFTPGSNRAKYCPECAVQVRRRKEAERQRKRYYLSTHLGAEKPL